MAKSSIDIELADGSTVVADADYLRRSITDPQAQVVAAFTISMPTSKLTDPEVSALIAYEITWAFGTAPGTIAQDLQILLEAQ